MGETLTADTSGIADTDGLTGVSYSYQWIRNDGTSDTDIQNATGSSYPLVDVDEGQTIKVEVSFTDDAGNDETLTSTATDAVEAPQPPAKPTGLSAAAVSHDAVTLTWDNPQDDTITGYVILRRDREIHPVGTFNIITGDTGSADTTYTDDTVEPDNQYVYRIKAINEHGEVSEKSDWIRADTPAVPVPDKPTGLSAAVSHHAVTLAWGRAAGTTPSPATSSCAATGRSTRWGPSPPSQATPARAGTPLTPTIRSSRTRNTCTASRPSTSTGR